VLACCATARAETLTEYAKTCNQVIGEEVPDFDCEHGTIIPTTDYNGESCDRPNRLNRECDPDSRFLVLKRTNDVEIVALCRKKGQAAAGYYRDIAVIQYNKSNGATYFYQALGDTLKGQVQSPLKGTASEGGWTWYSPASTASIGCAACHDNGALIRSPYLSQLTGTNALPGAGDFTYNGNQPYKFIGDDFSRWMTYKVEISGNVCITCHRMGTNNVRVDSGATLDLGVRSTAPSETNKNPHGPMSPIRMPPMQTYFNQTFYDAALALQACARRKQESPLPNSPKVELAGDELGRGDLRGRVKLGMTGQADIVTGQESLLTLLVKTVRQTISLR
jgi:hypothetical protein